LKAQQEIDEALEEEEALRTVVKDRPTILTDE